MDTFCLRRLFLEYGWACGEMTLLACTVYHNNKGHECGVRMHCKERELGVRVGVRVRVCKECEGMAHAIQQVNAIQQCC